MTNDLYPLRFAPVYKDYPWGGDRILRTYRRNEPGGIYAESWEVADRDDGMSVVTNGPLAGRTLRSVVELLGGQLLGTAGTSASGHFPLLIKLIDSRERLSVQVHPDDEAARRFGGEAKTEMWYILDADPGAGVFAGLRPGTSAEQFKTALERGAVGDLLVRVPVEPGDAIFTPGGRVHAIDAGCLILEIQQNSNTTYRIHDWGRTGADGKPRELHIEQALQVTRWEDEGAARVEARRLPQPGANQRWEVLDCPYFRLERLELRETAGLEADGTTFHVLFAAEGAVAVEWAGGVERLGPGDTCLVPAALGAYQLRPEGKSGVMLVTGPGSGE